jgi:hypothetical protein
MYSMCWRFFSILNLSECVIQDINTEVSYIPAGICACELPIDQPVSPVFLLTKSKRKEKKKQGTKLRSQSPTEPRDGLGKDLKQNHRMPAV